MGNKTVEPDGSTDNQECFADPLLGHIRLHEGDESWHDGKGWYYTLVDYPDEGSCGAFKDLNECMEHAEKAVFDDLAHECSHEFEPWLTT